MTLRIYKKNENEFLNTFGSNLSFKADVLKALGGFRSAMRYSTNEEYRFVKSLFTNFWKKFEQKDEEGRFKAKSLVAFGQVLFMLILTSAAGLGAHHKIK